MLLQGNNYVIAKWSGGLLNIQGKKPNFSSPLGGQEGGFRRLYYQHSLPLPILKTE